MAAMEINREQFGQMAGGDKPVLVDFWAPWCWRSSPPEGRWP